jgi:2-iminobutanoate/2-iminopropanoate deaminase
MRRGVMPQPKGAVMHGQGMVPGINAGGFLFLSAIRGRDPETGVASDDTSEQARQALRNLEAVLAASGATLEDVVKVTLYLHDLSYRTAFHKVWMEFFPKDPPARIAFQVADANPAPGGNAHFALDVIALAPPSRAAQSRPARPAGARKAAPRPAKRKRAGQKAKKR